MTEPELKLEVQLEPNLEPKLEPPVDRSPHVHLERRTGPQDPDLLWTSPEEEEEEEEDFGYPRRSILPGEPGKQRDPWEDDEESEEDEES